MDRDQIHRTKALINLLSHVSNGLQHVFKHGWIHGNLKHENILFVDTVPKLSGFDLARKLPIKTLFSKGKLERHMAPEVLSGEEYTEKIDLWWNYPDVDPQMADLINGLLQPQENRMSAGSYQSNCPFDNFHIHKM